MRSEAILVKNEGELIPQANLEKVLSNNTSSIGCAIWHPEQGFVIDREPVGTTLKEMLDHQNDCKGQKAIYWFCESVGAVAPEDLQPFTIIGDKDDEGIVAFCIGAFSMKNDGQFSDGYVFAQKYLKPKLNSMFKAAGEDLDKLAEMLASEEIKTDMELAVSPNKSTVAIMLAGGKSFLWSEADRSTTDKWGFVSDNYGLKETASQEATKSVDPTPRKRFGVKASAAPPAETKPDAPVVQPTDPTGTPDPNVYRPLPKPDEKVAAIHKGPTVSDLVASGAASAIPMTWCSPNPNMGMKKKKDWYKEYNSGVIPQNVEKCPPIQIPTERALKLSGTRTHVLNPQPDASKTFATALAPIASTESLQQQKDKERIKDTESHHIPKPVVSAVSDIKKAAEVLQASKSVQDPKDWEALENKYVPLHKRIDGITETAIIFAPRETRTRLQDVLSKDEISAAWMHSDFKYMEAVQYAQSLQKKIDDLKAKYEPVEKKEAATAEQPKVKRFGIKAAA